MNKKTLYGKEARDKVLAGVKKISNAVKVTLGPMGRNVLISQSMVVDYGVHSLPIHVTKDGYTVARAFDLSDDPFEKAGVLMIKEAVGKTVMEAGDGTTTCCVLAEAIVLEGMKLIDEGANPMDIKRGIDKAVEYVVEELRKMATPIKGDIEKIRQIATISANNDAAIGNWIAQAFEKIGDEGIIDIEASTGVNTEIKISDGYKWGKSWISPLFINNKEKQLVEFDNPVILLYDKKINHHTQVERALTICMQLGKPILIVCEDAIEEGLAFLAMNTVQGRVKCCVVKAPGVGEFRREEMEDIALITGGTYVSDLRGVSIKEIEGDNLGTAKKVIVTKDETIIVGGNTDKEGLENLLNELRMNLAQAKNEDEKYPIEKRIARLTGGVAVIQVGAATETEMKEKLDRFDDAVRATKAAISEGFVPGGGTAFLRVGNIMSDSIEDVEGVQIIKRALSSPLRQIIENTGNPSEQTIEHVRSAQGNIGLNAKTNEIVDLVEAGVIDPVKVLRCALQNAASSAGMILTCEALICDTL
jgi:chaperonin GroEL